MDKPTLRSHPPNAESKKERDKIRTEFIAGKASISLPEKKIQKVPHEMYPWEDPYVRDDVKKLFSLRLPEPEMLKLQFINKTTGKSMHQFILEAVLPAIENEIERLVQS